MFKQENKFVKLLIIVSLFVLILPQGAIYANTPNNPTNHSLLIQEEDDTPEIQIAELIDKNTSLDKGQKALTYLTIPGRFFLPVKPERYNKFQIAPNRACVITNTAYGDSEFLLYSIPFPSMVHVYNFELNIYDVEPDANISVRVLKHDVDSDFSDFSPEYTLPAGFKGGAAIMKVDYEMFLDGENIYVLEVKFPPNGYNLQFCSVTLALFPPLFEIYGDGQSANGMVPITQ